MDLEVQTEARRRKAQGEPPFKVGDTVMVDFWHTACWQHSVSQPYVGRVVDLEEVVGGKSYCGGNSIDSIPTYAVRIEGTIWQNDQNKRLGITSRNEYCAGSKYWALLKATRV